MSKQINLTLAKSGDVAVLRNGEQVKIASIQSFHKDAVYIRFYYNVTSKRYEIDGTRKLAWATDPQQDITDILRNGASIFEPK